jgi:FdhE protein
VISDIERTTIAKIDAQEREEGALPLLLAFYREVVTLQGETRKKIKILSPPPSSEVIEHRLTNKLPLLDWHGLELDWALLEQTFRKATAIFARYPQLFGDLPDILNSGTDRPLSRKLVEAWFNGKKPPQTALVKALECNLLNSLVHAVMKPYLLGYAQALAGHVDQEAWRQRYCPVCGGAPDFSYLEKEVGSRYLVCSRCDTEWLFQRIECPYCGNKDQKTLAYFTDDESRYRLYVCDACKHYLKAIDLRKTGDNTVLPLERFYTLDIDRQAREKGYSPFG